MTLVKNAELFAKSKHAGKLKKVELHIQNIWKKLSVDSKVWV